MYTAKVIRKDVVPQGTRVFVDFIDGATVLSETCIPQNVDGLKYWIKSRLETLNSAPAIESAFPDGVDADVSDPVVTPPTPTPEEIARKDWLADYYKWIKVKTTLIDTGILTGNETKVLQLKTKVQNNFLPAYLDFII